MVTKITKENQKICIELLEKCLNFLMKGEIHEAETYLNVLYEYFITLDKLEVHEIAKIFDGENIQCKTYEHAYKKI